MATDQPAPTPEPSTQAEHHQHEQRAPYRICFVCTGNICRSPTAEIIMQQLVDQAGLGQRIAVDSAGTGNWHEGEGADQRAVKSLAASGYDGDQHRARQIQAHWLGDRDLVIALDRSHLHELRQMAAQVDNPAPIVLLRSFEAGVDQATPPQPAPAQADVIDPYQYDAAMFDQVREQIEQCCTHLVQWVRCNQLS